MPLESDLLLAILKWCLLVLLYLFFFRVLQATVFGSGAISSSSKGSDGGQKPTKKPPGRRQKKGQKANAGKNVPTRVRVLKPPSVAGKEFVVADELTFGRAPSCHVTLEDTYLSQLHMRVTTKSEGIVIEDFGSTNGTFVNGHRIAAPVIGSIGDNIRIGEIVMELR